MSTCQGTTKDGRPCSRNAKDGLLYCWQHASSEMPARQVADSEGRNKLLTLGVIAVFSIFAIYAVRKVPEWANRLGMVLEFLSFWFAAPEIATEIRNDEGEWLRALERGVEQGIQRGAKALPFIEGSLVLGATLVALLSARDVLPRPPTVFSAEWKIWAAGGLLWGWTLAGNAEGVRDTSRQTLWGALWALPNVSMLYSAFGAWSVKAWTWIGVALVYGLELWVAIRRPSEAALWAIVTVLIACTIVAMMWTDMNGWWGATLYVLVYMAGLLMTLRGKVVPPMLRALADDQTLRRRWLKIGVAMFVVGFLLQFISTF